MSQCNFLIKAAFFHLLFLNLDFNIVTQFDSTFLNTPFWSSFILLHSGSSSLMTAYGVDLYRVCNSECIHCYAAESHRCYSWHCSLQNLVFSSVHHTFLPMAHKFHVIIASVICIQMYTSCMSNHVCQMYTSTQCKRANK